MGENICLMSDSYKFGHHLMYPEGTTEVYSFFEARKGACYNKTVFFGLQRILDRHFAGRVVTREKIDAAEALICRHLGPGVFNRRGWERILDAHDGRLPVEIKAVPEGTPVLVDNVLMTVRNTDPECHWLTNYLETMLSHAWYPSTVATLAREIKILLKDYLERTSDNLDALPFQLHDFGCRGASSLESAEIGGCAHLVSFKGTDNVPAIACAMEHYGSDVCAFSVPASEHSVMTAFGREGEMRVMGALLRTFPEGVLSIVIDSYDYMAFIKDALAEHRDAVLARGGKVVFRPDSGDPVSVTLEVLDALGRGFGSSVNSRGFRTLNPRVGVLWGDGLDYQGVRSVLFAMRAAKWASDNIVFGMGGGLLQKVNRDTQRFAFKCSSQTRGGVEVGVCKLPRDSSKASKSGKLALVLEKGGEFATEPAAPGVRDELVTVFRDGETLRRWSFDEVRKNALL